MTPIEFQPWPKTPRLNRDMHITEKIDGTNACVIIGEDGQFGAQSRNRLITPESDNYGFAKWVWENHEALAETLGPGHHFGEWWGNGIQRGYGLANGDKRFSLFNTHRWKAEAVEHIPGLHVVPTLYIGPFDTTKIAYVVELLRLRGSLAVEDVTFIKPEGVIIYLPAADQVFKVLIENDDIPKTMAVAA